MPFDFKATDQQVEHSTPVLPPFATGWQGLRNLAYVLRNPVLWPANYRWNFGFVEAAYYGKKLGFARKHWWSFVQETIVDDTSSPCGTQGCSIGIGRLVWPEFRELTDRSTEHPEKIARMFGMPWDRARDIFLVANSAHYGHKCGNADITPGMVADAIDSYLARTA